MSPELAISQWPLPVCHCILFLHTGICFPVSLLAGEFENGHSFCACTCVKTQCVGRMFVYIKHFRFSVQIPYLDIICNLWFLLGTILCDNTTSERKSRGVWWRHITNFTQVFVCPHHMILISVAKHCFENCPCLNHQEENKTLVTYCAVFISLSLLGSQDFHLLPVDGNTNMFWDMF